MGEQRARVAAGHLFLWLSRLSENYTRGGVRVFAAPAAGQRINLGVGGGGTGMGWIKTIQFQKTSKSLLMQPCVLTEYHN
jgi:hypothetical protein